ncbi:MAG: hypothetical protein R2941_17470 [Desulfobacterales bacterium]
MKKFVLMILICCLLPILYGCGSDDDDENTDTGTVINSAESAFFYKYTSQNIETPFYAYSNTEFTINMSGNCDYQFDLLTEDKKTHSTIASGTGVDTKAYMNLDADNYFLDADVESVDGGNCQWEVVINAMFAINGSGSSTGNTSGGSSSSSGSSDSGCTIHTGSGCCNNHGGVASCNSNGKAVCSDGWISSCDCSCY